MTKLLRANCSSSQFPVLGPWPKRFWNDQDSSRGESGSETLTLRMTCRFSSALLTCAGARFIEFVFILLRDSSNLNTPCYGYQYSFHFFASRAMPCCTQAADFAASFSSSSSLFFFCSKAVCLLGTCLPFSTPGRASSFSSHVLRWGKSSSEIPAQSKAAIVSKKGFLLLS